MKNQPCPLCHKGTWRPWRGTLRLKGIDVPTVGEECSHCRETFFSFKECGKQQRFLIETFFSRGIRTGDEFTYTRRVMGLKASDLAKMLGVTAETISRWERDVIPIPRLAAFAVGELYEHPRSTRAKLAVYDAAESRRRKNGQRRRTQ